MRLFGFILLAVAVIAAVEQVTGGKVVGCYWGTWSHYRTGNGKFRVENIDPSLCTHLYYAFFGIKNSGAIKSLDPYLDLPDNFGLDNIAKTVALKKDNPNLKVLASVGGWNEGSTKYSKMAADPIKRAKFIKSSTAFLQAHGFDGLDLDWEYPNQRDGVPADKENYVTLLQELKTEFNKKNYILTVAVAAAEASASLSYNISALSNTVDLINVMTYDYVNVKNKHLSFNSPLQGPASDPNTVTASIDFWLNSGASASKLVLGIPFNGRTFTMTNPSKFTVNSPANGGGTAGPYTKEAGILGYNEFCELHSDWTQVWNSNYLAPYAYKGDQWMGYDNRKSIKLKMKLIKNKKLAGAYAFGIETDDFRGLCGEKYGLLNAINNNGVCKIDGIFPNKEDPTRYIVCDGGKRFDMPCPPNLVFNEAIKGCDYPPQI